MDNNLKVIVIGELFDKDGNLKQKFVKHNLITNKGYDFLCNAFANTTRPNPMKYIAVGSDTVAPRVTDIALGREVVRQQAEFSHATNTNFLTLGTTLDAGVATGALTEAGIFNASTGGDLFDRVTFPVINKDKLDTYRMTFNILFKESEVV